MMYRAQNEPAGSDCEVAGKIQAAATEGRAGASAPPPPNKQVANQPSRAEKKRRATPMRDRFVVEYLKDFNATRAAIRAGYSPKTAASQGQRLLKSATVGKAISRAEAKLLSKAHAWVESIMKKAATIAFMDPGQLVDNKGALLPIEQMPVDARRGLTRLKVINLFESNKANKTRIGRRCKLSFTSKIAALRLLGKYLGMARIGEVAGQNGKPLTPAQGREPLEAGANKSERSTSELLTPSKTPPPNLAGKPPSRAGMKGRGSFMRDRFSVEYLKDFNATKAAKRAGYSPTTAFSQGQRLLKSAAVRKAIAEAEVRSLKNAEISVERWLKEVEAIAFVDFGKFFGNRGPLPLNKIPEENRRALTTFEFAEVFDSDGGEKTRIAILTIDCSGKAEALDMLSEYLKI